MRLSIVDLGTVAPGTTEKDGLSDALETARHADAAGFHRIWFAEHHLSRSGASHHPELLIPTAGMHRLHVRRFINPAGAAPAMQYYREQFQAQGFGLDTPRAILAVIVTVGDTSADAQRLVGSAKGFYARLRRGNTTSTVPSADEATGELTQAEADQPTSIVASQWPQFVAGNPEEVRATLEQMADESGADELMVQDLIADPKDRRHSHDLLAATFDLKPQNFGTKS